MTEIITDNNFWLKYTVVKSTKKPKSVWKRVEGDD